MTNLANHIICASEHALHQLSQRLFDPGVLPLWKTLVWAVGIVQREVDK